MAQTTDSIWGGAAKVEVSSNGSNWTDISGHSNNVTPAPTERRQGSKYTFLGENPITKVGKKNIQTVTVGIIYTEETADAFEVARAQFEAAGGGTLDVRWSPAGGTGGDALYKTLNGMVQSFNYPAVNSEEDGPMVGTFVIQCSGIDTSTVST